MKKVVAIFCLLTVLFTLRADATLGGQSNRCSSFYPSHFYATKSLETKNSALGDLTLAEIYKIQSVVNEIGFPIVVVGSASKGMRRNVGTDLPIRKDSGGKSDIDYALPLFWRTRNREERNRSYLYLTQIGPALKKLPDMDTVFVSEPRIQYPRIWFIPNRDPVFIEANGSDPMPPLPPPIEVPAETLKTDVRPIGNFTL